jgi:hypothetical protein
MLHSIAQAPAAGLWRRWITDSRFLHALCQGGILKVLLGQDSSSDTWSYAALPSRLPPGRQYQLELPLEDIKGRQAALLGWALGEWDHKLTALAPLIRG